MTTEITGESNMNKTTPSVHMNKIDRVQYTDLQVSGSLQLRRKRRRCYHDPRGEPENQRQTAESGDSIPR